MRQPNDGKGSKHKTLRTSGFTTQECQSSFMQIRTTYSRKHNCDRPKAVVMDSSSSQSDVKHHASNTCQPHCTLIIQWFLSFVRSAVFKESFQLNLFFQCLISFQLHWSAPKDAWDSNGLLRGPYKPIQSHYSDVLAGFKPRFVAIYYLGLRASGRVPGNSTICVKTAIAQPIAIFRCSGLDSTPIYVFQRLNSNACQLTERIHPTELIIQINILRTFIIL